MATETPTATKVLTMLLPAAVSAPMRPRHHLPPPVRQRSVPTPTSSVQLKRIGPGKSPVICLTIQWTLIHTMSVGGALITNGSSC